MGRTFFTFLLFLCYSVTPVFAISKSYDIHVTATVTPSPEWISLLRKHSTIDCLALPFLNFDIYQLHLTDGQILIRNQPVSMLIHNQIIQSSSTDSLGNVSFVLSKNISLPPSFVYPVAGQNINLIF